MPVKNKKVKSKWKLETVIANKDNRLWSYPYDYFNSK